MGHTNRTKFISRLQSREFSIITKKSHSQQQQQRQQRQQKIFGKKALISCKNPQESSSFQDNLMENDPLPLLLLLPARITNSIR